MVLVRQILGNKKKERMINKKIMGKKQKRERK